MRRRGSCSLLDQNVFSDAVSNSCFGDDTIPYGRYVVPAFSQLQHACWAVINVVRAHRFERGDRPNAKALNQALALRVTAVACMLELLRL